jgi:hypothetical protein
MYIYRDIYPPIFRERERERERRRRREERQFYYHCD